jgi:hypothetical protein
MCRSASEILTLQKSNVLSRKSLASRDLAASRGIKAGISVNALYNPMPIPYLLAEFLSALYMMQLIYFK